MAIDRYIICKIVELVLGCALVGLLEDLKYHSVQPLILFGAAVTCVVVAIVFVISLILEAKFDKRIDIIFCGINAALCIVACGFDLGTVHTKPTTIRDAEILGVGFLFVANAIVYLADIYFITKKKE